MNRVANGTNCKRLKKYPIRQVLGTNLVTLLLVLEFGTFSLGAERSIRSYQIPGHGALAMVVPNRWKEDIRQPSGRPLTISFSPATGNDFKVLITVGSEAASGPGSNAPPKIRALLERQGQKVLGSAVESRLVLEELRGREAVGYFYSLTDRAPKSGEYPYMVQGALGVDNLLILFTVLLRDKNAPERQAALEMLTTVTHKPK